MSVLALARRRSPALGVGDRAPALIVADADGASRPSTAVAAAGGRILLLFVRPGCASCAAVLAGLAAWPAPERGGVHLVVIAAAPLPGPVTASLVVDAGAAARFGIASTPAGVLLDAEHRVAGPPAHGGAAIDALVGTPRG